MKKMNILILSLAIISTTIYSMEGNQTPSDGSGSDMPAIEELTLGENEPQPQPTTPSQTFVPPARVLQTIGGSSRPIPIASPRGFRPSTPPIRIRPIGEQPSPSASPAGVTQHVIVAPSPRVDTPNAAFTEAAREALRAYESGEMTSDQAMASIRQFLPPRSGRSSENRNPEPRN